MTCKDCFHYEECKDTYEMSFELDSFDKSIAMQDYDNMLDYCKLFKDKNKVIELPCKSGDTVYEVQEDRTIQKWFVYGIIKYDGQEWAVKVKNNKNKWKYIDKTFAFRIFGKTVFITKEEAEKALKLKENEK